MLLLVVFQRWPTRNDHQVILGNRGTSFGPGVGPAVIEATFFRSFLGFYLLAADYQSAK
jgi:hypothetical protein